MNRNEVSIIDRDYWVKVVGMLQQNWALIDDGSEDSAIIHFVQDGSVVFDSMTVPSREEAEQGLKRNGFKLYSRDPKMQKFISPPQPPFYDDEYFRRPIYSSGEYWSLG